MQGKIAKTVQTYQIQGENDVCSAGNNKLLYIVCVVKRSFKRLSRPLASLRESFCMHMSMIDFVFTKYIKVKIIMAQVKT